jgi:uncharacterized protein (DUF3084 family)
LFFFCFRTKEELMGALLAWSPGSDKDVRPWPNGSVTDVLPLPGVSPAQKDAQPQLQLAGGTGSRPCLPQLASPKPDPGEASEMVLRSVSALKERRFAAWRGRSGRRYVTSVFAAGDDMALGFADAVMIAVSAGRKVLAARDSGPFGIEAAMTRWRDSAILAGAQEIHVHLLAESAEARRAAVLDLTVVVAG